MAMLRVSSGRFRPEQLFRPRSIAVVGADTAAGQAVLSNLREARFAGQVEAVADAVALGGTPDLAVIATAAEAVPGTLRTLAARGVFAAICLTPCTGLGPAARAAGIRVMGPSSFGIAIPALRLNCSTAHLQPRPGRLALVSQSAALCRSVLDWAEPNGVGFSHIIGSGGNADMGFALALDWLSRDPGTGAILLDIRTIRNRRAFLSAARAAARLRPVVAIRAGGRLSDPSGRADAVFDAALRRAGVVRVARLSDLLAAAETLTRAKPLRHESLEIVTNAVGPAQMAADAASVLGIPLASVEADTQLVLDWRLPPGPRDPGVVWTGADQPIRVAEAVAMLSAAPEIGGIVAVMAPTGVADAAGIAALAAAAPSLRVPLLACVMGETTAARHRRTLADAGIPTFATPELAVRAFGLLVSQRRARAAAQELPSRTVLDIAPDRAAVTRVFAAARAGGRTGLLQNEALSVLAAYGLPVVPSRRALTAADAAHGAAALGFPAVLKLARNDRPRTQGPGGVMLDLMDQDAVHMAARQLDARRARAPDGLADGFVVQHQHGRTRELRITVADDALFGPAIGFGPGGSASDLLGDVAVDLPPLNRTLAQSLVSRTRVAQTLAALHDQAPADTDAVVDALVRISQLVVDFPEIAGIDVNPLFADAHGVAAADAWIGLRDLGEAGQLAIAPYPAELAEPWQSGDERLLIRPIRPEDAEAHAALFQRLTPEDIRYRFFSMMRALSPEQIARMTQVDYDREMAFVAVRDTGETVGVARLVRDPYGDGGEFAIVVEPALKGHGLGRTLMRRLMEWGAAQGMTSITGQVLAENLPMLAFMRRLGFALRRLPEDPEVMEATRALV